MPDTASSPIVRLGSGATITTLVTPEGSNGAFSLYRWDLAETTRGPSEHFHRGFAESFILLSGEVAFYDGRGWRDLTIGEAVHARARQVHALRKANDEPAAVLMLFVPGVSRHRYFAELAALDEHASAAAIRELHRRHDNEFGPPPDETWEAFAGLVLPMGAVHERTSRYGDKPAIYVGRREIAHSEAPGVIDLRITGRVWARLRADYGDDCAVTAPTGRRDWIELTVGSPTDLDRLLPLIAAAVTANQ